MINVHSSKEASHLELSSRVFHSLCHTFAIKLFSFLSANIFVFIFFKYKEWRFICLKNAFSSLYTLTPCGCFSVKCYCMATCPVKFAGQRRRRMLLTLALPPISSHSSFNWVASLKRS